MFVGFSARREGENQMNWEQVEGNWQQFTGKVKEKWGKLTDDDLTVIGGRRDVLAGKLRERYGMAKEQAEKEMDRFLVDYDSGVKGDVKSKGAASLR
jgi:uncharacterized protein YjbJ (UPF0337 family)